MNKPLISVIVVDYKRENPYLLEIFEALSVQSYQKYEVILVTDHKNNLTFPKLTKKSYGRYVGPAQKRDDGASLAKGEILAFLDDDAYPSKDWLQNIVKEFKNVEIAAVGGPGITPPNVSWAEEASGWASASPLGSGKYLYRFLPQKRQFVEDFPSMNLAVLKTDFFAVGGFDSNYWPGEDTKLCLDLVYKLNKKIVYNPRAIVYHHRRPVLFKHLRQNGNFGLHRGFFARVLPETSLKIIYFFPASLFLLLLFYPLISELSREFILFGSLIILLKFTLLIYFILLFANAAWIYLYSKKIVQSLISVPVIFITHIWYGVRFLQGLLFTDKLDR